MLKGGFVQKTLSGAVAVAAMLAAAWSDDLPLVPAPEGFVEASALVPPLKDQALIGHPAGTRLIGVYLLPDELASIPHGGVGQVTIFCRAYVISEFGSEEEATASFGRMIAGAKREASKKFDPSDSEVARVIQRYADATKQRQGQSAGISGATILGSILETQDAYAVATVVAFSVQTDKTQVSAPLAAAVAWLRRGTQVLEISAAARFDGTQSIARANGLVVAWVKSLEAASVSPGAIATKRSRWLELEAGDSTISYDLDTVKLLTPNKFTIVSTTIDHNNVVKFRLNALKVLRSYCTRPAGYYDAPSELFTLGEANLPVTKIEVKLKEFPSWVIWSEPYLILATGSSLKQESEGISHVRCEEPSDEEERQIIMSGSLRKELYDCDRRLMGLFAYESDPLDKVVMSEVRGLFSEAYNRLCPIVTGKQPYSSPPE